MGFWLYMLGTNLLIPLVMIIFGWIFKKAPPQNINDIIGYRTARAMKNQETWQFANKYMGKKWFIYGLILLPMTIIAMLPLIGKDQDTVGRIATIICLVELIPMIFALVQTEIALKKTFDKNGNKKENT